MAKPKDRSRHRPNPEVKTNHPNGGSLPREVEFILACLGAKDVYVCGDFNQWQPTALRMIETLEAGLWKKRLVLPPGRHEYKFVVDGKWLHDPEARENIRNSRGSLNSVLEVRP